MPRRWPQLLVKPTKPTTAGTPPDHCSSEKKDPNLLDAEIKFRHLIAVRARARNAAQMAPAVGEANKANNGRDPTRSL